MVVVVRILFVLFALFVVVVFQCTVNEVFVTFSRAQRSCQTSCTIENLAQSQTQASILDFSLQSCKTKSETESLGLRLNLAAESLPYFDTKTCVMLGTAANL